MYGWRGRVGLLIPSSNTTMEKEFKKVLPGGVSLHTARVRLKKVTVKELEVMEEHLLDATDRLADAKVDIIVFGCTTGSLIKGYRYDLELSDKITKNTGILALTTSTAVVEGLEKLKIKKVCIATPYIKEVNEKEEKFFTDKGFKVINIKGLEYTENTRIGNLDPGIAYKLAKETYTSECDGIFISCTNFRTMEIIETLEKDLEKPVISSNQATFWATLKRLNIKEQIENYGSLLKSI